MDRPLFAAVEKTAERQLRIIRHGESQNNSSFFNGHRVAFESNDGITDPRLTPRGIKQLSHTIQDLLALSPKYVFVSPLRRALETSYYLFKDHPSLPNIRFIVQPLIMERLSNISALPTLPCNQIFDSYRELEDFHYDFSLIDDLPDPNMYSFNLIDYPRNKNIIQQMRENCQSSNYKELNRLILEYIYYVEHPLEEINNLYKRVNTFFKYLNAFIEERDEEGKEDCGDLVAISHVQFIKIATASRINGLGMNPETGEMIIIPF